MPSTTRRRIPVWRARRRAATTPRDEPRRSDVGDARQPRSRDPVLHHPRDRCRRRQLPGQHRLRPRLSASARRGWGIVDTDDCIAAARFSPTQGMSTGTGWRSWAAAPAAIRRCVRWRSTMRSQLGCRTSASPTAARSPRTPTSSRAATSIRSSGRTRKGRPLPGTVTALSRRRHRVPGAAPAGRRRQGRAPGTGRGDGRGAGGARGIPMPTSCSRARVTASARPRT